MCVIFIAHRVHTEYPLIVLANRDEFYERPTAAAGYWEDHPGIYAGRDLLAGGTWLGVAGGGRFAAVTNYREQNRPKGELSRGELVAGFLKCDQPVESYLQNVQAKANLYSGFNLIVGIAGRELFYFSNRTDDVRRLEPGSYGMSNHLLNSAWPKVTNGLSRFETIVSSGTVSKTDCFELLSDETLAADTELPNTGVELDRERSLSSILVRTPNYGTRSSTVVLFDNDNRFDFEERVYV